MHLGHVKKRDKSNPQHNIVKLDVGLLLLERVRTILNLTMFILEIDLTSSCFS
jgi:hypothetical protein